MTTIISTPTLDLTDAIGAVARVGLALNSYTAVLTGTMLPSVAEASVRQGGKTIIITLSRATWHSDIGGDNAKTQALLDGILATASPVAGWNVTVQPNLNYSNVSRDSDTQVTVSFPAMSSYEITTSEEIVVTVPQEALTAGFELASRIGVRRLGRPAIGLTPTVTIT